MFLYTPVLVLRQEEFSPAFQILRYPASGKYEGNFRVNEMAYWIIVSKATGKQLSEKTFEDEASARERISKMGPVLGEMYTARFEHSNSKIRKMINEGLVRDDLEGILLPKVSVDEYVPSDPNSDNVVIAFYIKGVPEAVMPFKNFTERSNGVLQVDYGDSETISDCSVVYVEFDRENLDLKDIHDMMIQVGMLSGLTVDEFTVSFPNTKRNFPYSPMILKKYFEARSRKANAIAQRQALVMKTKELEDEIRDEIKKATKDAPPQAQEAPQAAPQGEESPAQGMEQAAGGEEGGDIADQLRKTATESLINRLVMLI